MGTNYYVRWWKTNDSMNPKYHIGKKAAAGLYCWDCGVTLCKWGEMGVHLGDSNWFKSCPKCGGKPIKEGLSDGSAGRELGFNKTPYGRKTGVASCSSFTWCMPPEEFLKKNVKIWNEYGDTFTKDEFLKILEECPIQFKNFIGEWFS